MSVCHPPFFSGMLPPFQCAHDPQGHFNFKPTKPGEAQTFLRTLTAKLETDMQAFGADLAEEESRDDELLGAMLASQKRRRCSTLFEYVRFSSNVDCHPIHPLKRYQFRSAIVTRSCLLANLKTAWSIHNG
jgi:hypothetical protein